jgi:hypothetical protein
MRVEAQPAISSTAPRPAYCTRKRTAIAQWSLLENGGLSRLSWEAQSELRAR